MKTKAIPTGICDCCHQQYHTATDAFDGLCPACVVKAARSSSKPELAQLVAEHADMLDALCKCKAAVENQELPPSARMELVRDYATPVIQAVTGGTPRWAAGSLCSNCGKMSENLDCFGLCAECA